MKNYGKLITKENQIIRLNSILESAFDYAANEEHVAKQHNVMLTEYDSVERNGKKFYYEYSFKPDMKKYFLLKED